MATNKNPAYKRRVPIRGENFDQLMIKAKEDMSKIPGFKPPDYVAYDKINQFVISVLDGGFMASPKLYNSVDEISKAIDAFFQYVAEVDYPINVNMLAAWLGVSRQTMDKWEKTDFNGFADVISRAKTIIALRRMYLLEMGAIPSVSGTFALRTENGYIEEQHIKLDTTANITHEVKLSPGELEQQVAFLLTKKNQENIIELEEGEYNEVDKIHQ